MPLDKARDRVPSVSMPSVSVGKNRKQAVWRAGYATVYWLAIFFVGPFIAVGFLLYTLADISWQLLTNRDGLRGDGLGGDVFERQNKLREYITFGKGSRDSWKR
jgi:hypothetical protein